jgi:hypothetical protein
MPAPLPTRRRPADDRRASRACSREHPVAHNTRATTAARIRVADDTPFVIAIATRGLDVSVTSCDRLCYTLAKAGSCVIDCKVSVLAMRARILGRHHCGHVSVPEPSEPGCSDQR